MNIIHKFNHLWDRLFYYDQYFMLIRKTVRDSALTDTVGYIPIYPPKRRFYADPFIYKSKADGKNYLFFEDYSYNEEKAHIACMDVLPDGQCVNCRKVLEMEYHLSYPFIFEYGGDIFMMPETKDNWTIEVFRAVRFPDEWVLHKVVMDNIRAVDTTIFNYQGKYWLFTNIVEDDKDFKPGLYIYYSDSPFEGWTSHPQNPVVTDTHMVRPAGEIFERDGMLIRPGQDCSTMYGYSIVFNRIVTLTESRYEETVFGTLLPDPQAGRLYNHTYNFNEDFELIDGVRRDFNFLKPLVFSFNPFRTNIGRYFHYTRK